ncbi:MAG TPA: glycoside hydrolase family 2 protein [Bryobacteraceae bacterium]|jgi:exo-1,4-beta-D-glucosaminidase|nr:glycoside hydrolase family 2 protein [Bryobacteraceae bacterium]
MTLLKISWLAVVLTPLASAAPPQSAAARSMLLRQGWEIQSSDTVRDSGAALSTPDFSARGWYSATVPTTVLSALVADRVYPDPYTGMNLRSIPGVSYPIGFNFSNLEMPPDSPFRHSWWFRTDFQLPASYQDKTIWLAFDGISFRANLWMNGKLIAASDKMAGTWRLFEFDVTAAARPGGANSLAVEMIAPLPHDLATTFVDWNPQPPDKNMGLWRDVRISATGPVALRFPSVTTNLNSPANDRADLTIRVELKNAANREVAGVLHGKIDAMEFSQPVRVGANQTLVVHHPLTLDHPRLWWPVQAGEQNLYPLDLRFDVDGKVSDEASMQVGLREVTSELDANGHRLFRINGQKILVRGGGYSFDMLLRSTPEKQEQHLQYVRDLNLNAVRFEGKLEDDHFLELCDRYGILVLPGWCCCDHWEQWQNWDAEDQQIAGDALRDQLRRLARHPAVFDWLYGSDNPPPPKIEKMYLDIIKEVEWPNPYQSSASAKPTSLGGQTGVKMSGPYEYVAPSYWEVDTKHGGAFGFNTETSPGPAPPPLDSLKLMLPEGHLWPIDSTWDFHAGGGAFKDIHVFSEALDKRYGAPGNVEEFARKAQVMSYEGERAMFEAYGRNKFGSTGVIQWMLNNAWPSMIWHLYDWYMRPGGSYFGAKKGCEPLHIQYSYDDRSIAIVNSYFKPFSGMKASVNVYNLDMSRKFSRQTAVDVEANSSTRLFQLPDLQGLSSTYFIDLLLTDAAGKTVSRNFYWLSTSPETLDFDKSTWYVTPTRTFADYTALNRLPTVDLNATARSQAQSTTVTVTNPGKTLAFAVHLAVKHEPGGEEILPVLWQDNYFALLPGESRQVTATYSPVRGTPVVEVDGWNIKGKVVTPAR